MARLLVALWLSLGSLLVAPSPASAAVPFRTVVGPLTPAVAGLKLSGAPGCALFLLNQTGQDVLLLDGSSPPLAQKFQSVPKSSVAPPPRWVPLVGNYRCATLPGVTEDQQWNNVPITVQTWTLHGLVGTQQFQAPVQTVYDPELDSTASALRYLRMGATVAALGALVAGVPYLLYRRRQILAP